jgi:hypothetical protein
MHFYANSGYFLFSKVLIGLHPPSIIPLQCPGSEVKDHKKVTKHTKNTHIGPPHSLPTYLGYKRLLYTVRGPDICVFCVCFVTFLWPLTSDPGHCKGIIEGGCSPITYTFEINYTPPKKSCHSGIELFLLFYLIKKKFHHKKILIWWLFPFIKQKITRPEG